MSDQYVPTTEQVRNNMALGVAFSTIANSEHREDWIAAATDADWPATGLRASIKETFDAWLAAHTAETKRQGAEEALADFTVSDHHHCCTPGCDPGCDIGVVRTWSRTEVVERVPEPTAEQIEWLRSEFDRFKQARERQEGGSDG